MLEHTSCYYFLEHILQIEMLFQSKTELDTELSYYLM